MGTTIEVDATGLIKNMGRHHGPTMFIIYYSGDCVLFPFRAVATPGHHGADDVKSCRSELFNDNFSFIFQQFVPQCVRLVNATRPVGIYFHSNQP